MAGTYELWYTDDHGVRIAQLDYSLGFSASILANGIGRLSMQLPPTFDTSLLVKDRMIQVWRAPAGGRLSLWRPYFLQRWSFQTMADGEAIQIYAADPNVLLTRRNVIAYSGAAQADKTDYADDMMKEVVTEAIADGVAPTPDAGTRVWADFSIAADLGLAPELTDAFAYDRVLTSSGGGVLGGIVKASQVAGTNLYFDVAVNTVSSSSITFQFRTKTGQPGGDLSDRVVFDQLRGNLKNPYLDFDYSEEVNYVYGTGQGEGAAREIQQSYDATRYSVSQWNRCEGVADARNQAAANGVREAARAALEAGKPVLRFSGEPVDTTGSRFGIDWNFGDLVSAVYRGYKFASIIEMVNISVNDSGAESIAARLDYTS